MREQAVQEEDIPLLRFDGGEPLAALDVGAEVFQLVRRVKSFRVIVQVLHHP
jgi:hypothetical protein